MNSLPPLSLSLPVHYQCWANVASGFKRLVKTGSINQFNVLQIQYLRYNNKSTCHRHLHTYKRVHALRNNYVNYNNYYYLNFNIISNVKQVYPLSAVQNDYYLIIDPLK